MSKSHNSQLNLSQTPLLVPSANELKRDIIMALIKQGYNIKDGRIKLRDHADKDYYKSLNKAAVAKKLAVSSPRLKQHEDRLIQYIANGREVFPEAITPKIVLVKSKSEQELLFRYACLHWSIPVSSGYGRRLRFLVMDESNGKLIGIFGLCDPVYAIQNRDNFIGWDSEIKKEKLYHIMDAYVLGAVPPYSTLLCGKLVALLTLSNEVRIFFRKKYANRKSIINKQTRKPWLVMITTTSALGRSSIYNRIKVDGYEFWRGLGFTQGSGEFHFYNGVYEKIKAYVEVNFKPTAKKISWGKGFRNRREIIKKCLPHIGLSSNLLYHGIQREIFAAPLARNAIRFLCGKVGRPGFYNWPAEILIQKFIERWLLPRAERVPTFCDFNRESYRLWSKEKEK